MISTEAFAKILQENVEKMIADGHLEAMRAASEGVPKFILPDWKKLADTILSDMIFHPVHPGEVPPGDKGPIALLVSHNEKNGDIRIDFGEELKWFVLPKDLAIQFGITILQHCGIPVNITMAPAPGDPA